MHPLNFDVKLPLFPVHTRWPYGKDLRLLLECQWTLGGMQCLGRQHHASLADGKAFIKVFFLWTETSWFPSCNAPCQITALNCRVISNILLWNGVTMRWKILRFNPTRESSTEVMKEVMKFEEIMMKWGSMCVALSFYVSDCTLG